MFEFVRTHKRLFQLVLVLLIFPSFVFFGVQGYSGMMEPSNQAVATVDGKDIKLAELDAAHREQVQRIRERQPDVDLAMLDTPEAKRQVLDNLVNERMLDAVVAKDHIAISDERARRIFETDPAYAQLRNADGSVSSEALAAMGMTSEGYLGRLKRDIAVRQATQGVTDGAIAGAAVTGQYTATLLERRDIELQHFPATPLAGAITPTDAQVAAHYKANPALYRSPESAQIEYLVLDLDALKAQVNVTEDELRQHYEANKQRYEQPEERRASHILIATEPGADAAARDAAKAKAEALLAQVRKTPGAFAELARRNSQDPGSAAKGGDLDFFAKGAMVKPFEDAVWAMKPGEISDVVASDFGFHIIQMTGERGGGSKTFEQVRAELQDEVALQQAQKRYAEVTEQFTNTVFEQPDSLAGAADKLGLKVQTATVQRQPQPGAGGPLASPKLLAAVFNDEAIKKKHNTEAIETGPSQLVSARVVSYTAAALLPLEQVREQVVRAVQMELATAQARKQGEERLAAVKADPTIKLPQALTVSRTATGGLPRPLIEAALRAKLAKAPAVEGVDLGPQGYVVLKVIQVAAQPAEDPSAEGAKRYVENAILQAEMAAYINQLKTRFKVQTKGEYAPGAKPAASAASAAS